MSEPLHEDIKAAIVRSLRLPIKPEEIGDQTPLFGPDGLGLDSVDVLELVLELERSFGVTIENQDTGMQVLRNVETIAEFVRANQAHKPTA
jgi:acyl carrier protein